jgi:Asp-tRNA(Asn)/Glu-tRNA(Gln) amidotransferase A subunit family amidase
VNTAAEVARSVRAGELHPIEAVEPALQAIERHAGLNAVITACADQALTRAHAGVSGPLAGVPLLVKDVFDTAGVRTTAGSRIFADRIPGATATAVATLEAAGAIVVAKTSCDEFAWGVTGQNHHYGDCANPRRPGRITGGSSSGNAAGLAAGLAPLALGSDTGGSVRMPAPCCEVVGMKPRVGVLPTAGMFPLCPSFDTPGPMARTVRDCALAYALLSNTPLPEGDPRGLRAGVLTAMPPLAPDAPDLPRDERALELTERVEALGLRCRETALPIPEANLWPVFYGEAAAKQRDTFPARRDEYGPTIRAKLDDAQRVDRHELDAAYAALAGWRERARTAPSVDVFVSPTLGVTEIPPADVDELEIRVRFSAYTRVSSFLGWPAIAIGGVQIAARDVGPMFALALAWERAYGPPG